MPKRVALLVRNPDVPRRNEITFYIK